MRPPLSLVDLAVALGGDLVGDGEIRVSTLVHPAAASSEADLVFVMEPGLVAALKGSPVRGAVVAEKVEIPEGLLDGFVRVPRPRLALADLLEIFGRPVHAPPGVHPTAVVDASAVIGPAASIGPFVHVGPDASVGSGSILMSHVSVGAAARIGENCLLHSGARIGERVCVGNRVIVHHNASIGADGFSFVTSERASFEAAKTGGDVVTTTNRGIRRINSIGTVVVGDDVEIGASSTIDRANIGATVIGRGTKIDNQVQIAHNCRIGEDCLISGCVGISGSCRVGDRVVLAGGVGLADHIEVGDDAVVGAGSGVWRDVAPRQVVVGYPAAPKSEALERELNIGRLRRLVRDVADLRRRLTRLDRR